jgi:hypothetical protein
MLAIDVVCHEKKLEGAMAETPLQVLEEARAALVAKRLTWAKTIATPGEISEGAIKGIIEIQEAIHVIDRAIEELEYDEEYAEDEDE